MRGISLEVAGNINLRIVPFPLRPIALLIAIVLVTVCDGDPRPPLCYRAPLGRSSLDYGRLWQRRRPLFLCTTHLFPPSRLRQC
jgi:hypothetical protein